MPPSTPGLHHVTAVASDPQRNLEFYTETLGLRLVKRSVNQDDESTYHFFYGDRCGTPGTSVTFFPFPDARPGRIGVGQVSRTSFSIPPDAVGYWLDRFDEHGVDADSPIERFDETVIPFRDPDGLELELVASSEDPGGDPWHRGPVPAEAGIRGLFGVSLPVSDGDPTAELIEALGYEHVGTAGPRRRYETAAEIGGALDLVVDDDLPRGRPGAGTVHHVAFRMPDAQAQREWRDGLREYQFHPTDVIDRKWFQSICFRERNGIRFELATDAPGYTVDENRDSLGERLVLPAWLEPDREQIRAQLPDVDVPAAGIAADEKPRRR